MKKINWKKVIGWTLVVLIFVGVCVANSRKQQAQQNSDKRNVYALLPLTGGLASIGQEFKMVIDFAMKNKKYPFNIIYVDSESTPMKGITALQAATASEKEPIVFSFMSSVGSAVAPYLAQRKGFMFAVCSQSINATTTNYQHVATSLADQLDPFVPEIVSRYKSLDIVYVTDEFGLAQKKYLVNALNQRGFTNIHELALPLNLLDPRNEVVKLLAQKPEAIFVMGNPTLGYINLLKNLKEQDFNGDVLVDAALSNPSVQKNVGKNANGVFSVSAKIGIEMPLSAKEQKLKTQIESLGIKINSKPIQAMDALELIAYTLDHHLPFDRQTYENLKEWQSCSGDIVVFKNGQSSYPTVLSIYRDGKYYPANGRSMKLEN